MMHRINRRGTYVIDRRYKGIGRIRRASGASSRKTFNQILSMLKELHETGRHTVLREIRDGVVTPIEAYGYWREEKLEYLPSAATLKPILPTIPDWIDKHEVSEITKRNYKSEMKRFAAFSGETLAIQDLPAALQRYREYCTARGTHRTFNYLRTTILAYLRGTLGKNSHLWQAVSGIRLLKEVRKRQAPQLSVVEMVELIQKLPPPHADIARAMVFTGMHWSEILGEWLVEKDRVVIRGTKAKGRNRSVPLIDPDISRPARASKAFRTQLRKVRPDISPYSFRRSYAHWMEEAGITRIRRRMYLGHGDADVTDKYERVEVERFLRDDAERLKDYIFQSWEQKDIEKDTTTPQSTIFLFKSKKPS